MNAATATRPPPAAANPGGNMFTRFRALFAHNQLGNFLFISAIIIGFFHGWLKLRFRGALTTFAFDIPLMLALIVTLASVPRMDPWIPNSRVGNALKAFVGVACFYLIMPFGVPLLAGLSAFRAWCFIPLTFALGYHLVRSVRQVELYFWLIIILAAITAVYGMRQSPEEIRAKMAEDAEFAAKFFNTFYSNSKGEAKLRVFSTFVTAAAFGGTMAYCVMFAISRFSVAGNSWKERIILLALAAPMAYGIVLSGSRTSMFMMATGLIFTAWYRRNLLQYILVPVLILLAFKASQQSSGNGDSLERFSTLMDPQSFIGRLSIVVLPMFESLMSLPFGGGLGRSGHGLPAVLSNLTREFDWRPVDGDLGRLGVEMGFLGITVFFWLLIAGVLDAFRNMKELRDTPLAIVGVPAGAMFMIAVGIMPTGSPFLAIPNGALLWFFLGALDRLTLEYRKLEKLAPEDVKTNAMFVSFIQTRKTRLLFNDGKPEAVQQVTSRIRAIRPPAPKKRFLFQREQPEAKPLPPREIKSPNDRRLFAPLHRRRKD